MLTGLKKLRNFKMFEDDMMWTGFPSSWDLNLRNPELGADIRLRQEEKLRRETRILLKQKKKQEKRERRKNK